MNRHLQSPANDQNFVDFAELKLFEGAPPDAIIELERLARFRSYDKGQVIIDQDERTVIVGFVIAGTVKILKRLYNGDEQIVRFLFPKDFLGRLFQAGSRFSYETVSDVTVCVLDRHKFQDLLSRYPQIEHLLLQNALEEIDLIYKQIADIKYKTAMQRTAKFLCNVSKSVPGQILKCEKTNTPIVTIPISRSEMANFLGITPETVSRNIQQLSHQKIIRLLNANAFKVIDAVMLSRYANEPSGKRANAYRSNKNEYRSAQANENFRWPSR